MATKKTREDLRQDFKNGLRPNQEDFAEVFESFVNFEDDINSTSVPPVNFKNGLTISGGNDNPNLPNGTIRWDGNQFVQLKNGVWTTFGGSKWEEGNYNAIFYKGGDVGIGIDPNSVPGDTSKLVVDGKIYSKNGGFKFPDGTEQTSAAVLWEKKTNDSIVYNKGNVGIGTTTSPSAKLHVDGSFKINPQKDVSGIPIIDFRTNSVPLNDIVNNFHSGTMTFTFDSGNKVLSATAALQGWYLYYDNDDIESIHEIKVSIDGVRLSENVVSVDYSIGMRDSSGKFDDPYSGFISIVCIAKLKKSYTVPGS